ncbi:MAG: hypothetical protein ACO1RT_10260 [Planctomycetaceae bacterium]
MKALRYMPAAVLVALVTIAAVLGCCSIGGCIVERPATMPAERTPRVDPIPGPVPDPLPNLTPEEYAEMSGLDASTEQTRREQVRNNDLEDRVRKLEIRQRAITMRLWGVPELRIVERPGLGQLGDIGAEALPESAAETEPPKESDAGQ